LQLSMQSEPTTTNAVSSNSAHGEIYSICDLWLPMYPEKTTDLSQVTDKQYNVTLEINNRF
jgi:hypothetical protein